MQIMNISGDFTSLVSYLRLNLCSNLQTCTYNDCAKSVLYKYQSFIKMHCNPKNLKKLNLDSYVISFYLF